MNPTFLIIVIILLAVLVAVFAYNMHQENQYRRKIRSQFGHADNDALLGSRTQSVRDGKSFGSGDPQPFNIGLNVAKPKPAAQTPEPSVAPQPEAQIKPEPIQTEPVKPQPVPTAPQPVAQPKPEPKPEPVPPKLPETQARPAAAAAPERELFPQSQNGRETAMPKQKLSADWTERDILPAQSANSGTVFELVQTETPVAPVKVSARRLLIDLDDLRLNRLKWFDPRFDFMAYIALPEPQELHALPRLSGRCRFQIVGCTLNDHFQTAEPIPGVAYKAFVIGLQAISRSGLATAQELEQFGRQVAEFAGKLGGDYLLTDIPAFLSVAGPLDALCARVDQTIAIHLVSRETVAGTDLRREVENLGFQLLHDGSFGWLGGSGESEFNIVTIDGSAFSASILAQQAYKGFSMLFDITRVPAGEEHFDQFMDLATRLAIALNLDLVDDQLHELSSEWKKDVRRYVLGRQNEMLKVDIEPGSETAKRLFA